MRKFILLATALLPAFALAAPGVDIEANSDTVMKVIYSGSSPNTSHPSVLVKGKKLGVWSVGNSTSGSRGVVGLTGSNSDVAGSLHVGVYGAGTNVGVYGYSNSYDAGVQGLGYNTGVKGTATNVGMEGSADYIGVSGYASEEWGYGVYGEAEQNYSYAGYFQGNVYSTGYYDGSDLALKEGVRTLDKGLETILALQPKAYRLKADRAPKQERFGLIAQEVQAVVPEIVKTSKVPAKKKQDGSLETVAERAELKAVNYVALVPVLIKAMQEQQAEIEKLKSEITQLKLK